MNADARRVALVGRTGFETATLKRQLKRVEREKKLVTFGLILPALLYMIANFVVPVGVILFKSVDDRGVSIVLHPAVCDRPVADRVGSS